MILTNLLLDIQNRIMEKVPALKYVDEDWGQFEYEPPTVAWPCALVDVDGFDYTQMGNLAQQGTGTIYIRVAFLRVENTSGGVPLPDRQAALLPLDTLHEVYNALHGYTAGQYVKLIRTRLVRVKRTDKIREYLFTFKTAYTEAAPPKNTLPVQAQLVVRPD